MKKFASISLAILMVISVLMSSFASVSALSGIEFTKETAGTKITVHMKDPSTSDYVDGAEFTAYQILDLVDDGDGDGTYKVLDAYTSVIPQSSLTETGKNGSKGGLYTSTDALEALISDLETTIDTNEVAGTTLTKSTATKGVHTLENFALGVYLIRQTVVPTGYQKLSQSFLVTVPEWDDENSKWLYEVEASPKVSTVSVDKAIGNSIEDGKDSDVYAIGQEVPYTVEALVPHYGYSESDSTKLMTAVIAEKCADGTYENEGLDSIFTFKFVDTMSKGLTFNNNVVATCGDKTFTKGTDYTVSSSTAANGVTTVTINFKWTSVDAYQGKKVKLNYSATLNKDAAVETGDTNNIKYTYTSAYEVVKGTKPLDPNDPNGEQVPTETIVPSTDDLTDTTTVYTFAMDLTKTFEGAAATTATGATDVTFEIRDVNKNVIPVVATTDGWAIYDNTKNSYDSTATVTTFNLKSDGTLNLIGLDEGTYYLVEKTSAKGYSVLTTPVQIEVNQADDKGVAASYYKANTTTATALNRVENKTHTFAMTINNVKKQFDLPTTGGMGLWMFTIAGGVLMAGAIILFSVVRKKKASN